MARRTLRPPYTALVDRLNRFPQGAPPSPLLDRILRLLFSEHEAGLVASLPIKPFTAADAARTWRMPEGEARRVLDRLASHAVLLDMEDAAGTTRYVLPPPMAGFFEFSMMRVRDDIDQKTLAGLFYQYLNVEEDFIKALFVNGETQLGRTFVHETALPVAPSVRVLDYERASHVVESARAIGVGVCYCRHKMSHVGRACGAPTNICLTFGTVAGSLVRHGFAREIDRHECLDLLQEARDRHLVQFGDNVREGVSFVCNCCGCCCEAMIAARKFGLLRPVHTTNFLPTVTPDDCNGCGKCVAGCPVDALSLVSAHDARKVHRKVARLDDRVCLGCGVCVGWCPRDAIRLVPRPERVVTPLDSVHRAVVMAIERGKLQHLVFDQQAFASHRAMAAVLGVILKLAPVRQVLASRQVKSRYLEALIARSRAARDRSAEPAHSQTSRNV